MKSFQNFLTEGRDAPLYHGTGINNAVRILKENELRSSMYSHDEHDQDAISLTRNLRYAWYYSADKYTYLGDTVVFELDQSKLIQKYKIKPYNAWASEYNPYSPTRKQGEIADQYNEYEEVVFSKTIFPLDKYLTKIHLPHEPAKPIKGSKVEILLSHPKLYWDGKFVNKR